MVDIKQATRACQQYHTISMTKHIPVCKNTTRNSGQDAEEEAPASEGKTETVGKPAAKEPDTECLGCYRDCNGRESDGRNSTKYMGTSPTTSVNRET